MKTRTLTGIIILIGVINLLSQQQSEFIIGSYSHITPWPNSGEPNYIPHDSTLFSVFREQSWGFNMILKYVRQPKADTNIHYTGPQQGDLTDNMDVLKLFPNVMALNHYATGKLLNAEPPEIPNVTIRNFDYIYFYSSAYYSKWDAAKEIIYVGELGLKHEIGTKENINGKDYWSSNGEEGVLIKGPQYNQDTRYRGSSYPTIWDKDTVKYEAVFNTVLETEPQPEELDDPVCEISVVARYNTAADPTIQTEIRASRTLTAGEISTASNRILKYDFAEYCQNVGTAAQQIESGCLSKKLIDVEFVVEALDNRHTILIDYIEVYDSLIWWRRLFDENKRFQAKQQIVSYLQRFKEADPIFYRDHLKYFYSVDEPHSVDANLPLAFLQGVLDSLDNAWTDGAPMLFTHFYPEWNGYRNDANTIRPYVNTVKPKPFHFYYAPFSYIDPVETSLEVFRDIFHWVYDAIGSEPFWITIDVLDMPGTDLNWRRPNPEELNAAVMLSLAHGAKGILFENFYTYGENADTTGGLLNKDFTVTLTGEKVRDEVIPRLKGVLGNTLLKLSYTGNYAEISNILQNSGFNNYLSLYDLQIDPDINFHAGMLEDKNDSYDQYFFIS